MRKVNPEIEKYRVVVGSMGSSSSCGNNGLFVIINHNDPIRIIASDGMGWEHVSVSLIKRTPTWTEMCKIKDLFWADNETVVQYHPSIDAYVDCHPYCLHLWKKIGTEYELPPAKLI